MGVDNVFQMVSAPGRCLRASPGWTAVVAGAILFVAAALKAWQQNRYPFSTSGLRSLPGFAPALIGWELFLGLWLVSGALPQAARRVAIGCFSVFACDTLYEALSGKADCGCFGQVHVNPWFTFMLDAAIVLALTFLAKSTANNASRWSRRKWPVAVALGIGLVAGIVTMVIHLKTVEAANGLVTADGGKLVILEPHKWLGHRLPVLKDILAQRGGRALGKQIAAGQWIVMFYHASCEECRHAIPVYEQLAQQEVFAGKTSRVAFVRVPSDPPTLAPAGLFHSQLPLHGALDANHEWFAATPIVVELKRGVVVQVVTGAAAMNLNWPNTLTTDH